MTYFTSNVARQRELFSDIGLNAPFIDNRDQPRFLALNSNVNDLKNALAVMFFFEVKILSNSSLLDQSRTSS